MKEINHKDDRKLLLELLEHLDVSDNNLKRDELDYWNIVGRKGHIFTDSKLWYVFVSCESKRKWTAVKAKLKFLEISQDGDAEGILKQERMPSQEEAEVIREVLGLRKRPIYTEEYRATLIERGKNLVNKGVSHSLSDLNEI